MPILGAIVQAVRAIAKSFDPDKSLRENVANLEDCGSVDNRISLARSCMDRRMYPEATERRACDRSQPALRRRAVPRRVRHRAGAAPVERLVSRARGAAGVAGAGPRADADLVLVAVDGARVVRAPLDEIKRRFG